MTALLVKNISEMSIDDIAHRKYPYPSIELKLDVEIAAKSLNIKQPFSMNDFQRIADYMNDMED